jgi:hypothetical protein
VKKSFGGVFRGSKVYPYTATLLIRLLKQKFSDVDSLEIRNLHFFVPDGKLPEV